MEKQPDGSTCERDTEQGQRRGYDIHFWRSDPQHLVMPCHRPTPCAGWELVDLLGRKMDKTGDPLHCVCLPSPTLCELRPHGNRGLLSRLSQPSHRAQGPRSPSKAMCWVVREDPHHPSPQDMLMGSESTSCQKTQSFLLGAGAPPAYPVLHSQQ